MRILITILLFSNVVYGADNYSPNTIEQYLDNDEYIKALYTTRALYGLKSKEQLPILEILIETTPNNIDYLYTKYSITKEFSDLLPIIDHYYEKSMLENSLYPLIEVKNIVQNMDNIDGYLTMAECLLYEFEFYYKQNLPYFTSAQNIDNILILNDAKQFQLRTTFQYYIDYSNKAYKALDQKHVEKYNSLVKRAEVLFQLVFNSSLFSSSM